MRDSGDMMVAATLFTKAIDNNQEVAKSYMMRGSARQPLEFEYPVTKAFFVGSSASESPAIISVGFNPTSNSGTDSNENAGGFS